ncbi:hypothetical protein FHR87_002790 [Azomonas macrocytogenes]|uniref:Uncharacterized protein n=1 Tax=Azomonas macrocytogenes TaxID=69962 RepID=A0A839T7Z5_AZOMA|nr:hypothetical protein [Azomonas macrocytogenes]
MHGAEQFDCTLLGEQWGSDFAFGNGRKETSFYISSFIYTRRNTIGDQINEELFFAGRWILQQFNQSGCLLGIQRLGHNALGGTLFYVFAIGFKHSFSLIIVPMESWDARPEAVFKVLR